MLRQSCHKRALRSPAIKVWVWGSIRLAAYSVSKASGARQPTRYVHVNLKLGIEDERSRNERDASGSPFLASGQRDNREDG
jgi:hypothetical protein